LLEVSVSEIHGYPSRPEGFEEPLFSTQSSRRTIIEHFMEAPWLMRASELEARTGEAAHALEETIEIRKSEGRSYVVRSHGRRYSWRRRVIVEVLERWREVRGWWDEHGCVNRTGFRLLLAGGAVIDVAREHSGVWLLVGVVD
jgi:hypothetical protein